MNAYKMIGNLTKNFRVEEFANTQAKDEVKLVLSPEFVEHVQMLQELRDWYGAPLNVSSGWRSKSFNASIDGAKNSAHLDGLATDINNIHEDRYEDFTVAWQVICSNHKKVGGCNYYDWGMHFCSDEGRFGNKCFVVRDCR